MVGFWSLGIDVWYMRFKRDGAVTVASRAVAARARSLDAGDRCWLTSLPGNVVEVRRGELVFDPSFVLLIDPFERPSVLLGTGHLAAAVTDVGRERARQLWAEADALVESSWKTIEAIAVALLASASGRLCREDLEPLRSGPA